MKATTAETQYTKPYGLRKMIDAHDDLMASPLELIQQANPHMTMAGMLTRIARQDDRNWNGGNGMLRLAWESYQMIEAGRPDAEAKRLMGMVC